MLESQQPDIASKFVFIFQEVAKQGRLIEEFSDTKDRIRLFWSLMQIEKACQDRSLINADNLSFLVDVPFSELDSRHFLLYKQLVCLAQMYNEATQELPLEFERIYERMTTELSAEKRQELINEDPATKSSPAAVTEIMSTLKRGGAYKEVKANLSDDFMNLIDVACALPGSTEEEPILLGVTLMNKHCYLRTPLGEQVVKRSVELKLEILA